jgi:hypothetical protein
MARLLAKIGVVCFVAMLTGSALGLEIQLAPRTLVLSSGGDQLTIHTDFPYVAVDGVTLDIGDNSGVSVVTWDDDCGNLVVRCSKDAVRTAVGDFEGKFTTVNVTLTVNGSATASGILRVRK